MSQEGSITMQGSRRYGVGRLGCSGRLDHPHHLASVGLACLVSANRAGRPVAAALVLAAALLAAGGCANLGAVREFAGGAAALTDYRAATNDYLASADRQLEELPADARFDATRAHLQALKAATAGQKATLLKLHAATTGYMQALAQLAGADAYSVAPAIGKVGGAIRASGELGIDASHVKAYENIAQRVSDWALAAKQARDARRFVAANGADIDKLLEAMQLATKAYGIVLDQEQQAREAVADYRRAQWSATSGLPAGSELTPERRATIVMLLRRAELQDQAAQQQARKAQRAAAAGLARVRQAHAAMLADVDHLGRPEVRALLQQASDDLESIRQSLADL